MELNFVQSSEVFGKNTLAWETEFEATGDFNLHVERNKGGDILVYQRTAGSGYAIVEEFRGMDNKPAIDLDFTSVVYPKFVKIVSESQPTYATVTTDGEITEIKSQSKEIEVTSNGTTEVTPDAGFAYLNSVKVKTNVAQSGGGGGERDWKYFSVPSGLDDETFATLMGQMPTFVKLKEERSAGINHIGTAGIFGFLGLEEAKKRCVAIGIDMDAKMLTSQTGFALMSFKDIEAQFGQSVADMLLSIGFSEISESEFYNLNA